MKVLLVEDTKLFGRMLKQRLEAEALVTVDWAETLAGARQMLEGEEPYGLALLDLNLPDAPWGEVVGVVAQKKIPSVLFTATVTEEIQQHLMGQGIIAYILKDNAGCVDSVVRFVRRFLHNKEIAILVVDDSRSSRLFLRNLLELHRYHVLEANGAAQALALLGENPNVRLVLTDYHMPGIDGAELTRRIRTRCPREDLAIIGISTYGNDLVSSRFLMSGANDFIKRPFQPEEFHCRVTLNVEMIESFREVKESSIRDYLTGTFNRRHFFDAGERVLLRARNRSEPVLAATLDIDRFKAINDTYGHAAGDHVLILLAEMLQRKFGHRHLVARFGGEEFCVLLTGVAQDQGLEALESLRQEVESTSCRWEGREFRFTVSIGVTTGNRGPLEELLSRADALLYRAKEAGRNRLEAD